MLRNQCDHNYIVVWPLANPYINYQCNNIQCPLSQNVNFRLNTSLHGALRTSLDRKCHKAYFFFKLRVISHTKSIQNDDLLLV